jgi:hypothetical protein
MKTLSMIILLASSAFAQDQTAMAGAKAACGPIDAEFDVTTDQGQHPVAQPQAGKALVYVVEDQQQNSATHCWGNCGSITKLGLDGAWMGANRGSSYLFFSVEPGEHHLCTTWQTSHNRFRDQASLVSFTAESGHTYYFRARVIGLAGNMLIFNSLDLEPVNNDEGQLLVASSPVSIFHQKGK